MIPPSRLLALALAFAPLSGSAQKQGTGGDNKFTYSDALEGAVPHVYKEIGGVSLKLHAFLPPGHQATDRRPAIVFFFGGGWSSGEPKQFQQQALYLASRGMVAISADYRVATRQHVKAVQCVSDAKSAMRWVRANAAKLGIDPQRIAAGGGSAGGHIAACTGVLTEFDEPGEDAAVSSVPNAMVLFNPALVLAPLEGSGSADPAEKLGDRLGTEATRLSPAHHVRPGAPPTIIFHGIADTTVPFTTAKAFTDAMLKAGNRCELAGTEGAAHGFFNYGRGNAKGFLATLEGADRFLASLGWIAGEPSVATFFQDRLK